MKIVGYCPVQNKETSIQVPFVSASTFTDSSNSIKGLKECQYIEMMSPDDVPEICKDCPLEKMI